MIYLSELLTACVIKEQLKYNATNVEKITEIPYLMINFKKINTLIANILLRSNVGIPVPLLHMHDNKIINIIKNIYTSV